MRAYYKIFYAHMQALAETPDIKAYLEQKKKEALNSLAQPNVRPEPTPVRAPRLEAGPNDSSPAENAACRTWINR